MPPKATAKKQGAQPSIHPTKYPREDPPTWFPETEYLPENNINTAITDARFYQTYCSPHAPWFFQHRPAFIEWRPHQWDTWEYRFVKEDPGHRTYHRVPVINKNVQKVRVVGRGLPWGLGGNEYTCALDCVAMVARDMRLHGTASAACNNTRHHRYLDKLVLNDQRRARRRGDRASNIPRLFADLVNLEWNWMTRQSLWDVKKAVWGRLVERWVADSRTGADVPVVWNECVGMDPQATAQIAGCFRCTRCDVDFGFYERKGEEQGARKITRVQKARIHRARANEDNPDAEAKRVVAFSSFPSLQAMVGGANGNRDVQEFLQQYCHQPNQRPRRLMTDTQTEAFLVCPKCQEGDHLEFSRVFRELPRFLAVGITLNKDVKIEADLEQDVKFETPVYEYAEDGATYVRHKHEYRWYGGVYLIPGRQHFRVYFRGISDTDAQGKSTQRMRMYDGMQPDNSNEGSIIDYAVSDLDSSGRKVHHPINQTPVLLLYEHVHKNEDDKPVKYQTIVKQNGSKRPGHHIYVCCKRKKVLDEGPKAKRRKVGGHGDGGKKKLGDKDNPVNIS